MTTPVITVENLSKAYRIGLKEQIPDTLVGALTSWMKAPVSNFNRLRRLNTSRADGNDDDDIFWALNDVSFEVQEGEVLGIIGRNGAGKSTLLKVLSRITEPTSGRVVIRGRVSSLLEVGTGFHPEMTGRENVYMNGTILGMTKREIDRKFDQIVDFSGVEKFLDTPVKRYSSGMKVRLAFSVAAHLEPEILIIDEVLAVGDGEFQKKCLGKMQEVAKSGRTVLFVSHNMSAVENLCSGCILMLGGSVHSVGLPGDVICRYLAMARSGSSGYNCLRTHPGRQSTSHAFMSAVRLADMDANPVSAIRMGSSLSIDVWFEDCTEPISPVLGVVVRNQFGLPVFGINNRIVPGYRFSLTAEPGIITCRLDHLPLMPGTYFIDLYFGDDHRDLDSIQEAVSFDVLPADVYGSGKLPPSSTGFLFQTATWSLAQGYEHAQFIAGSG